MPLAMFLDIWTRGHPFLCFDFLFKILCNILCTILRYFVDNLVQYFGVFAQGVVPPFLISCAVSADHEEVNPCDEDQTEDLSRIRKVSRF